MNDGGIRPSTCLEETEDKQKKPPMRAASHAKIRTSTSLMQIR